MRIKTTDVINSRHTTLNYPRPEHEREKGDRFIYCHNKIIDSFSYTHDNVGNRLTKTEEAKSIFGSDKTINYTYDAIYRLQTAEPEKRGRGKLAKSINKHQTENYNYDAVGNRQSGPHTRDTYAYNAGNELITSTGRIILERDNEYEYDLNGNLIKKTQTIKNKWKLITTYAYDDENRLLKVRRQKGHKIKEVSFTYDPLGRRISKTVGRADFEDEDEEDADEDDKGKGKDKGKEKDRRGKPFQPRTTYYVYDDQNIIAEYDENNKLIASYIHGPNIDEPLAAAIRRDLIYYHADGLGSITSLTSHMGHAVQRYEYDSFGNMKTHPHWINQPFTYTAREFDSETGLYYYRARYYDAKAGRFLQRDPIGFEGGINKYTYAENNPISYIDFYGLIKYKPGVIPVNKDVEIKLECMEGKLGHKLGISDGKRPNDFGSEHQDGSAADISVNNWANNPSNGKDPCKIGDAALSCGFTRACKSTQYNHVHVDTRTTGTDCNTWGGYENPCGCNKNKGGK